MKEAGNDRAGKRRCAQFPRILYIIRRLCGKNNENEKDRGAFSVPVLVLVTSGDVWYDDASTGQPELVQRKHHSETNHRGGFFTLSGAAGTVGNGPLLSIVLFSGPPSSVDCILLRRTIKQIDGYPAIPQNKERNQLS